MNIFFSSVGITPVKWHKYQEQRRSRRRSTHFCKLSTKNIKSIFLGQRRRRGSSLFIQDFQTNPQIGFRSSGLQRKQIGNVVSNWEEKYNSENTTRISNIKNTTMQYTTVLEGQDRVIFKENTRRMLLARNPVK